MIACPIGPTALEDLPMRLRNASLLIAVLALGGVARAAEPDAAGIEFFEKKIRPVLVAHCYECHSATAEEPKGKLRLDSREAMMKGGETGPALVAGNVEGSILLRAIRYQDNEMPPKGKLPAEIIADFEHWVKLGAPDPRDDKSLSTGRQIDYAEGRKFWAFQPIAKPALPAVKNEAWVKTDIDRFVLAKLEAAGMTPSPPAEKTALLRRAYFDLVGLPPTPADVEVFLADTSPEAFAKVVDKLLASRHYGERWGRHWLDVARYGEDQAHTFQARMYPNAYRYRDWVVNSLNNDLPYDQFLLAQIAGDLLGEEGIKERSPALGFFAIGPVYYGDAGAASQARADEWDDRVDTLTRGLLGLTVACARCHDHKFDPIATREYYGLAGIIASSKYYEYPLGTPEEIAKKQAAEDLVKAQQKTIDEFLDAESKSLRASLANDTAKYLVASWRYINKRKGDSKYSLADSAKKDKLSDYVLNRWHDYLTTGPGKDQPRLAAWRELLAKQDPTADLSGDETAQAEVRAAAEAFQEQVKTLVGETASDKEARSVSEEEKKQNSALLAELTENKGVLAIPRKEVEKLLGDGPKKELKKHQDELAKRKKGSENVKLPIAHSLTEGTPTDLKIFVQGNPKKEGEPAPRSFLTVLSGDSPKPLQTSGSGRLELAKAIASAANPLTARVAVNRVWQGHFGFGLVRTASNFGHLGERPTHPELLDYLASTFIASGWSLKALHRQIMLSAVYQQSSRSQPKHEQVDGDNRLLWRMNRRRLEVEPWRDAMLAAAGTLDPTLGGPSINLADAGNRRRTLYGFVSRHQLNELLRLFDFPDPNLTSDKRTVTTVPLQQLFVLNSDFLAQQAHALASRLKSEADLADAERIRQAYLLLYGRHPTEREVSLGTAFLFASPGGGVFSAWEEYCLALLGANEFLFMD
jgi:cytochrome c553